MEVLQYPCGPFVFVGTFLSSSFRVHLFLTFTISYYDADLAFCVGRFPSTADVRSEMLVAYCHHSYIRFAAEPKCGQFEFL
jgi:hypothetical protein